MISDSSIFLSAEEKINFEIFPKKNYIGNEPIKEV